MARDPRIMRAVLPHPAAAGINSAYRIGGGHVYKSQTARAWQDAALFRLRAQGFRQHAPAPYWVGVTLELEISRLADVDGPVKLTLDAISRALGINDRWVGALTVTKLPVSAGAEQRIRIACCVLPVEGMDEFTALSRGWRHTV